jgi:methionine synthase II (cobalamin-independent)
MENLTTIVRGTTAIMTHVCYGKVCYSIKTEDHTYQLEIDSMDDEFKTTYLTPEFKAITLMRWIRKGIEDGSFIQLT